jgi:hypothetical protein
MLCLSCSSELTNNSYKITESLTRTRKEERDGDTQIHIMVDFKMNFVMME